MKPTLTALLLLIALPVLAEVYVPPPAMPSEWHPIPMPEFEPAPEDFAAGIENELIMQVKRWFNPARQIRILFDNRAEADNVNAFGEVEDNPWFTNRNSREPLSLDRIALGAATGPGPDTLNPWTIKRAKVEGVTPGFHIKDSRGDRYVIKFDPPEWGGLNSGADAIGAKFFWAAGYNTPENYIVTFDPAILEIGEDVTITAEDGTPRPMKPEDIDMMLERVYWPSEDRVLALASKYIPGELLGPFEYEDTREDDPNDFVDHEDRRDLRGQMALAVWINHYDAKGANSMDSYIGEDGEGYVRHYMMDFGTTLGSGGRGPHPQYRGYQDEADLGAMLRKVFTLGLWMRPYEFPDSIEHRSIGRIRNLALDIDDYRTVFPNPAYTNATDRDMYWGAKLVTSFSDAQIQAIVETGPYPPDAVDYLVDILIERRDLIGIHCFEEVNCLDRFRLSTDASHSRVWQHSDSIRSVAATGQPRLAFTDLWLENGYGMHADYRFTVRNEDEEQLLRYESSNTWLPLAFTADQLGEHRQLHVTMAARREHEDHFGKEVTVYFELNENGQQWTLLGLHRQD